MMLLKNNDAYGFIPFLFVGVILLLICIGSFLRKMRFLIWGKKVTVKIIKTIPCSNDASGRRVLTLISFEYNNEIIERDLTLKRKYIEGYNYKSVYIPKSILPEVINIGEVDTSFGPELLIFDFVFLMFALFIIELNEAPSWYNAVVIGIFFVLLLIGWLLTKKNKK